MSRSRTSGRDRRGPATPPALAALLFLVVPAACAEPGPGPGPAIAPRDPGSESETGAPARPAPGQAAKGGEAPTCDGSGGDCALPPDVPRDPGARSVLGAPLETCSTEPLTGWRRSGRCETGPRDRGVHVVCAEVTDAFLAFSRDRGNDLVTPRPEHRFPGLVAGDRWCLCAARWLEALDGGVAPPVVLGATEDTALRFTSLDALRRRAVDDGSGPGPRPER